MAEPLPSSIAPRFIKQYPCGCSAGPGPLDLPDYCPDHGRHWDVSRCVVQPYIEREPKPVKRMDLSDGFCPYCGAGTHDGCVAAERERCAKIAEAVADAQGVDGDGWPDCQFIAEKIRSGE